MRNDYRVDTSAPPNSMAIQIKSSEEIQKMRLAGRLAGEVLDFIAHARQDVPALVAEIRRLRGGSG